MTNLAAALRDLPQETREALASLHGKDDEAIEVGLVELPFGTRGALLRLGIARNRSANVHQLDFQLRPFGRDVIAACYRQLNSPTQVH